MIIRVVDIETSGLPEDEHHAICEIGWVDVDTETLTIANPTEMFVNPGHPMPAHIRAVHHISDALVEDAILPAEAVEKLLTGLGDGDILCAHRAAFEQDFIDAGERRWICTWKCAMRAWQDALSHSNQALRYSLDLDADDDFDADAAFPPHRALPDALVTAHILRRLLKMRPVERLIQISAEPPLAANINFGKHKGSKWADLPGDYLGWIVDKSDMDADTKGQAAYWLDRRRPRDAPA